MKLVVGLGNPGERYTATRHNVGFRVIDSLADQSGIDLSRQKFNAWFGDGAISGEKVGLVKPTTYMNRSGQSVQAAMTFFKLPAEALLVVMDDLDLPVGRLRIRPSGSAGGHRGLDDIIRLLGTDAFARVRIGIGAANHGDAVDHVLGVFSAQEQTVIDDALVRAARAVRCWIEQGVAAAMNEFNRASSADGEDRS